MYMYIYIYIGLTLSHGSLGRGFTVALEGFQLHMGGGIGA